MKPRFLISIVVPTYGPRDEVAYMTAHLETTAETAGWARRLVIKLLDEYGAPDADISIDIYDTRPGDPGGYPDYQPPCTDWAIVPEDDDLPF